MTEMSTPEPAADLDQTMDQHVAACQGQWKEEARALEKLATAFGPLAKPGSQWEIAKLPGAIDKIEAKISALAPDQRSAQLLQELRADLDERRRRMQESLAKDLREACEEQGLELRVIRREAPVEVRMPPFAVRIDREKGRAQLLFARQLVAECEAQAQAIVDAHAQAQAELSRDFSAQQFFDACLRAWRASCAVGCGGAGERVEILDFLPYLALQMQSGAFSIDPSKGNFRDYGRARFAFDMLRLRNEGGLSRDGWRMNLGVATGTTATKKNRTIFFEDEQGSGEFKLTVFFSEAEAGR